MNKINMKQVFLPLNDVCISEEKKYIIWKNLENGIQKNFAGSPQRSKHKYTLAAAAAIGLTALIACVILLPSLFGSNNDSTGIIPTTVTQPSASDTKITEPMLRIVYGEQEVIDSAVPPAGKYFISGGVSEAIMDPLNATALFNVALDIYGWDEQKLMDLFIYEGKTLSEWKVNPDLTKYQKGLDAFWLENVSQTDLDSLQTPEEKENYLQGVVSEWDTLWDAEHQSNPSHLLSEAEQAFSADKEQIIIALISVEADRLMSLGLDVFLEESTDSRPTLVAYLSKEQIDDFPCGEYGYYIRWANRDDSIDS
jgi:hypothetical protein